MRSNTNDGDVLGLLLESDADEQKSENELEEMSFYKEKISNIISLINQFRKAEEYYQTHYKVKIRLQLTSTSYLNHQPCL